MTAAGPLAELVIANRPGQFTVLEAAMRLLSESPAVTHLLVRGSLAAGTSDRLSDVDLVAGVREADFAAFAGAQDALIAAEFCQVLPGWPDTIVPDFGGVGWVHLIQHEDTLCQLDLYLATSGRISDITARTRGQVIYTAPDTRVPDKADSASAATFTAAARAAEPGLAGLITEMLVLAWMIRKRITRGQRFMAYKEAHQLTTAARALARAALTPRTAYLGWYHLEETLGTTPIGRSCLDLLASLAELPTVPTAESLPRMLDTALAIAALAAPDEKMELQPRIDAFLYFIDQR